MGDLYQEAYTSTRSDEHNGDRERLYEKQEAQHDVHEPTTYERKDKYLLQEMMGEQYDNYFWDEKHAL
jgi:hypothetical protein